MKILRLLPLLLGLCTANAQSKRNPASQFVACAGVPPDQYLWLTGHVTGQAGRMLRGQIPFSKNIPARTVAENQ